METDTSYTLDMTNVVYIDEYPELKKKVWLRRLSQQRVAEALGQVVELTSIIPMPRTPTDVA